MKNDSCLDTEKELRGRGSRIILLEALVGEFSGLITRMLSSTRPDCLACLAQSVSGTLVLSHIC